MEMLNKINEESKHRHHRRGGSSVTETQRTREEERTGKEKDEEADNTDLREVEEAVKVWNKIEMLAESLDAAAALPMDGHQDEDGG